MDTNTKFYKAVYDNDSDEMKKIYFLSQKLDKKTIDIHYSNEYIFKCMCFNGNLDSVKLIWNFSKEINSPIDLKNDGMSGPDGIGIQGNALRFCFLAENDNSENINFIIQLFKESNIHIDYNEFINHFLTSCYTGNIHSLEFIWNLLNENNLQHVLISKFKENDDLEFKKIIKRYFHPHVNKIQLLDVLSWIAQKFDQYKLFFHNNELVGYYTLVDLNVKNTNKEHIIYYNDNDFTDKKNILYNDNDIIFI